MKVDENKNKKLPRKLRKIIVEKKRRERIDTALKQLKDILFGGTELQNDYMRMEKADILENVVKHLQTQQSTAPKASHHHHPQSSCDAQYRLGYTQCAREVIRITEHLCGVNSQVTQSLSHYLNAKVTHLTSTFRKQDRAPTPAQNTATLTSPPHRIYPECTSATGICPDSRVSPLHHSPNSAFHRVTESQKRSTPALDNISIAVYQYNHYNNFKNDRHRSSAESNINIRPVIEVESPSNTHRDFYDFPKSSTPKCDTSVKSNINIRPLIKTETVSSTDHSLCDGEQSGSDLLDRDRIELRNEPFEKVDSSMWRPW